MEERFSSARDIFMLVEVEILSWCWSAVLAESVLFINIHLLTSHLTSNNIGGGEWSRILPELRNNTIQYYNV